MSEENEQDLPQNRAIRFIVALIIISTLMFVIEILPLHYGAKSIPWNEMWQYIYNKLPRMIVIALMASMYLAFGVARSKTKDNQ